MSENLSDTSINGEENISLCEVLDRILNKGAVIIGDVTISVANVDLIYLGLQVILTSKETANKLTGKGACVTPPLRLGMGTGVIIDESI
jgi:hypothetical protein